MALVLSESKTASFSTGWKQAKIIKCKTGDYNGTKFYDMWFEGLPENMNCRVWETRNKDGEEFSIANLIRYSNPDIIEEMDNNNGSNVVKVDDSPSSLVGKELLIYIFRNEEGYGRISQKVVPAKPFKNAINDINENTIEAMKVSTEKWENSKLSNANGVVNDSSETAEMPF